MGSQACKLLTQFVTSFTEARGKVEQQAEGRTDSPLKC